MLHYYLQKGIMPDKILGLSPLEQSFFMASINLAREEDEKKWRVKT